MNCNNCRYLMVGLHAQCHIRVISTTDCYKKGYVHNRHAFKETTRYALVKEGSKLGRQFADGLK
jgi:hypothetical protein